MRKSAIQKKLTVLVILMMGIGLLPSLSITCKAAVCYYVSATGNDSNPGTLSQPFKTIQKAADIMVAGDTCYIAPGIYNETVIPANSGTAGQPITYQAEGTGVVVSASDPVTGWTLQSGNIYRTKNMDWTLNNGSSGCEAGMDQIFADGKMMVEARWPNIPDDVDPCAYKREYGAYSEAGSYKSYTKSGISSLPDPTGAYINAIAAAYWSPITGQVTSRSGDTINFTRPENGNPTYYGERDGDYFYLWGKLGFLDTAREWFRDGDGTLYLWTPNGDTPSNHLIEAKKRDNVMDLRGKSYLTFKGIETRGGAILTDTATDYLTLDKLDVQYSSHYSILTSYWATRNTGTRLLGDYNVVKNCHFANSAETLLLVTGSNALITNNVLHDAAYLGANGYVLGVNYSSNSVVSNNTCYGCGTNACIDIRYSPSCTINNNDCFWGSRITVDGGMVMTCRNFDGQNTRVSYNYIHDGLGPYNTSRSLFGTYGFYAEGGVNNYIVDHNVIWNVTGRNGIALGPGGEGAMSGWKIYNNTLPGTNGIICAGDNITYSNIEIKNNIMKSFWPDSKSSFLYKNILTSYWLTLPDNYNISDPIFANPAGFDFRLQYGSPAKDAGTVISPYTDGAVGAAPDIGACEYGRTPAFTAGALIFNEDIGSLNAAYDSETDTFSITGAPNGRYLPEDFKLKVGSGAAGGTVVMDYNTKAWTVTGVSIPQGGGQVYGQIGEGTPVLMNLLIESPTTLSPAADAYVRDGTYSTTNYGADVKLDLKDTASLNYSRKVYLKFDIAGLSSVNKAVLRVYGYNTTDSANAGVSAYGVDSDNWTETGITWSNAPARHSSAQCTVNVTNTIRYYEFDVTSFVQSQAAGDGIATLCLEGINDLDKLVQFESCNAASNRPQLVITGY